MSKWDYSKLLLQDFLRLFHHPYPDHSKKKLKVLAWYLFYAFRSHTRTTLQVSGVTANTNEYIWDHLNEWIRFQINFIDLRYWAKSPVILSVSGGHAQNFWKQISNSKSSSTDSDVVLFELAKRYNETFIGFSDLDFFYSLKGQLSALDFAKIKYQSEVFQSALDCIVEIGPGFGGVSSSVLLSNQVKYTGVDTPEMSTMFLRVLHHVMPVHENIRIVSNDISSIAALEEEMQSRNFSVVAQWSFSEIPINLRVNYFNLIKFSKLSIFISNTKMNEIDNFSYFTNLSIKLSKSLEVVSVQEVFGIHLPNYMKSHKVFILT